MTAALTQNLIWLQFIVYLITIFIFIYNLVRDRKIKIVQEVESREQIKRLTESITELKDAIAQKNVQDSDRDARIAATDLKVQLLLQQHTENHHRNLKGEAIK